MSQERAADIALRLLFQKVEESADLVKLTADVDAALRQFDEVRLKTFNIATATLVRMAIVQQLFELGDIGTIDALSSISTRKFVGLYDDQKSQRQNAREFYRSEPRRSSDEVFLEFKNLVIESGTGELLFGSAIGIAKSVGARSSDATFNLERFKRKLLKARPNNVDVSRVEISFQHRNQGNVKELIAKSIALCREVLDEERFPDRRSSLWRRLYIGCPSRVQLLPETEPPRGILLNTGLVPIFHEPMRCCIHIEGEPDPKNLTNYTSHHIWIGNSGFQSQDWSFMARTFGGTAVFWIDKPAWSSHDALKAYLPRLLALQSLVEQWGFPLEREDRELQPWHRGLINNE